MTGRVLSTMVMGACLAAQQIVVDRGVPQGRAAQRIELTGGEFLGDSFRVGVTGEIWILDAIRVWAVADRPSACLGKITLLGALDNPPVPGQPQCDCHAMVELKSLKPLDVKVAGNHWQLDFRDLKWSVPGGADLIFSVRAAAQPKVACAAAQRWSLAVSPAEAGYQLHWFDKKAVPQGLAPAGTSPRWINVQVWARK